MWVSTVVQKREYKPKSVSEFLGCLEEIQGKAQHSLWFRGIGALNYKLVPTLYRHPEIHRVEELLALEKQIMSRFRQRGLPYHTRDLRDDWDALFYMQHYGVPTRLLDWSENPLTALYFALMSAVRNMNGNKAKSAAVWTLDPAAWNKTALDHLSYGGDPLTPGEDALKGYSADPTETRMAKYPVALLGAHNSARIVAQQGVFTIFGTEKTAMETLVKNGTFANSALSRIVITGDRVLDMRRSLLNHGITESTIFPDLEGLAQETKRHFGFEV